MTNGSNFSLSAFAFILLSANKSGIYTFEWSCLCGCEHMKAKIWPIYGNIYEAIDTI